MLWWPWILIAFLVGSVPFGYLIGRAKGVDLRTVGSRNIGATNLGRVFGRRWFFLCFFLDLAKGLVPTALAGWRAGLLGELVVPADQAWWWLAVMAAAVLGHMFTPWLGFKGGKGVATGLGALLGIFPALTLPGVGALVVFLVVLGLWRYVSAASVAAAATLPLWVWYIHAQFETLRERDLAARTPPNMAEPGQIEAAVAFAGWPFFIVAGVLGLLVIARHRANLGRLARGTEPRIGQRISAGGAGQTPPGGPPGVAG
jgi:glycerol-3-phosphate acyltransferase PlsY